MLKRWWVKKYGLPPTHEAYLAYTLDELWAEFYEDYYLNDPNAAIEEFEDEDIQFVTGDTEYDELERRLAEGDISDDELNAILDGWTAGDEPPAQPAAQEHVEDIGDGFDDTYGEA